MCHSDALDAPYSCSSVDDVDSFIELLHLGFAILGWHAHGVVIYFIFDMALTRRRTPGCMALVLPVVVMDLRGIPPVISRQARGAAPWRVPGASDATHFSSDGEIVCLFCSTRRSGLTAVCITSGNGRRPSARGRGAHSRRCYAQLLCTADLELTGTSGGLLRPRGIRGWWLCMTAKHYSRTPMHYMLQYDTVAAKKCARVSRHMLWQYFMANQVPVGTERSLQQAPPTLTVLWHLGFPRSRSSPGFQI